ncbi:MULTISPECIES: hypothetical protein [unclassified Bacillus (in: firmicutes)]|nr:MULTISPECIES: hypothetical protein [unclassified Bacillus (in: firmicutes)]SFI33995.1 hypothetical protein SAMN04488574_102390 [Bacillus sp. 71mf]SFS36180.1 hypothetical protein SAMN04488145_10175 [Bacillus sp. 103mf]
MAKTYDNEFKLYAVKLVVEKGRKGAEVVWELVLFNNSDWLENHLC